MTLDQKYAEVVDDGLWPSPLHKALDAFNASLASRMTGKVRVRLHRGQAVIDGTSSPYGLRDEKLATYGVGDKFNHEAASGLIELCGLSLELGARVQSGHNARQVGPFTKHLANAGWSGSHSTIVCTRPTMQ